MCSASWQCMLMYRSRLCLWRPMQRRHWVLQLFLQCLLLDSSPCVSAPRFFLNNFFETKKKHCNPFMLLLLSCTELTLGGYLTAWVSSVGTQVMFLYTSCVTCPCFYYAYLLFLHVSSLKISLFNQSGLIFLHNRVVYSKFFIKILYKWVVLPGYPSLCDFFPRNPNKQFLE